MDEGNTIADEQPSAVPSVSKRRPPTPPTITLDAKKFFVQPPKPVNVVRLEIYEVDGKPFDKRLSKKEIKDLWLELGRQAEEVKQVRSLQILEKCCKLNFTLHSYIQLTEISKDSELTLELKNESDKVQVYKIKVANVDSVTAEFGRIITVSIPSTPDDVTGEDIKDWLQCFGELKSDIR